MERRRGTSLNYDARDEDSQLCNNSSRRKMKEEEDIITVRKRVEEEGGEEGGEEESNLGFLNFICTVLLSFLIVVSIVGIYINWVSEFMPSGNNLFDVLLY